jgi:hypothetical protein
MANEPVTREELLQELITALRDTDPPDDAFSVTDIMEATGWGREQVYGYLRKAKENGKVEIVGRYGALSYYRVIT